MRIANHSQVIAYYFDYGMSFVPGMREIDTTKADI